MTVTVHPRGVNVASGAIWFRLLFSAALPWPQHTLRLEARTAVRCGPPDISVVRQQLPRRGVYGTRLRPCICCAAHLCLSLGALADRVEDGFRNATVVLPHNVAGPALMGGDQDVAPIERLDVRQEVLPYDAGKLPRSSRLELSSASS